MATVTTRDDLLSTGRKLLQHAGYAGTGLQAILQSSGIPKGSFYHYFASKEAFCIAVVESACAENEAVLRKHLTRKRLRPLRRVRAYFEEEIEVFEKQGWSGGCLLGTLGQEVSDQSEPFRQAAVHLFAQWRELLRECFVEAQEASELAADWDADQLAGLVLSSWEGALLQMKIEKSPQPLRSFVQVFFTRILVP